MWAITTVSSLGDWLGVFALTFYVQQISGRPEFAVGGVLLFRVIPGLFFGPFAGVLADRFDRRRLMVTADVCRALLIAAIPWIGNLWALFAVSSAMEVLGLMWVPAKDATVPNLVHRNQLMTANQLSLITTYGTFPLGGALVAVLAAFATVLGRVDAFSLFRDNPTSLAFFVDAGTFLFSAVMVTTFPAELTRVRRARTEFTPKHALRDLSEGFRFVHRHPVVRTLVMGAWTAFTGGGAVISLGPIFAARVVGGSQAAAAAAWGSLIVAVGVGLVAGMAGAAPLSRYVQRERLFPIGLMVSGAAVIGTASMAAMPPAIAFTFFIGLGAGVTWVTIFTLLQERVEDRLRGRTFATIYTGIQLSLFIALGGWPLIAGAIGDHALRVGSYSVDLSGYRIALWAGGIFVLLAGVMTARGTDTTGRRRTARMRGLRLGAAPVRGGERRGLLIAFEGVEGSGKSTQLKMLFKKLKESGRDVIVTREPGGAPIAERIRHILLDPDSKGMDHKTEALLYAAARAQHVADVVRPALERGAIVLCDRYIDSSLAYQGYARGLGEEDVLRLNAWSTDETWPDLVILLHVDPEAGLARTHGDPDRIEQEDLTFHRRVADAYLQLARAYPSRFAVVSGSGSPEQVHAQVEAAVLPFLQVHEPSAAEGT